MDLLIEVVQVLDMASDACEASEDAARLSALADRVRSYLASSRPTTTLGMPRIPSFEHRLSDESVVHRSETVEQSHVRILPN
jgi:hypothetical protein